MRLLAIFSAVASTAVCRDNCLGVDGSAVPSAVPLGVSDADAAAYSAFSFTCLQSQGDHPKKVIPSSLVNDDFCDCPDGSDEPGTSACAGSPTRSVLFFCRNEKHEGSYISASRVGDNICDCCDGSDERAEVCMDSCEELAKQVYEANQEAREIREQGIRQRALLVDAAKETLSQERAALTRDRELLQTATASKETLDEKAQAVETREQNHRNILAASAQKNAEVRLGLHLLSHDRLLEAVVKFVREADLSAAAQVVDLAREMQNLNCNETIVGCSPPVLLDDADNAETEESVDNIVAADIEAGTASIGEDEMPVEKQEEQEEEEEVIQLDEVDEDHEQEPEPEQDKTMRLLREKIGADFEVADNFELADAAQVRKELSELASQLRELEKTVQDKENQVEKADYGPDNVWFAVRDTCFDTQLHGYTWKFCPLQNMKQDSVSLGNFARWENGYETMVFEGGTTCWNGPARSVTISLECGAESELVAVEEPSKCVYAGRFKTPLVCA